MFDSDGKLHIPILDKLKHSESKLETEGDHFIVKEAFCPKGHSLMSKIRINGRKGIKFFLTDTENKRETEIVVSPILGKHEIITLSGEVFQEDDIIKAYCPTCHSELEVLVDCECGAHIYVFYLDNHLDRNFGISFCSRVGCTKSSKLRFSEDTLMDYLRDHIL
jgi:predicted Zn-ribbon and HTH transcriptional regulator